MIFMPSVMVRTFLSLVLIASFSGCLKPGRPDPARIEGQQNTCSTTSLSLGENESLVSIIGTNDIHGTIQPKKVSIVKDQPAKLVGGMAFFAGAMKAIRDGVEKKYGEKGGVLLLDGGDQFQGTLLSNYSEGHLMFSLMNEVGYDAIVPGNHDYDFGPMGWLEDQVNDRTTDKDPRGVIKSLAAKANFPLLSANTYYKSSLKTIEGKPANVDSVGCASNDLIDWSQAKRPEFLRPFTIKTVAGVRVAVIGLDNPETSRSTTFANVSDLCFRSSLEEYKSIRASLDGAADIFVIAIHDGDINQDLNLTKLLQGILKWRADGVDAIVGGHTHTVNKISVGGVYGIQSAANGERFGRIDLVYDHQAKKVLREKTHAAAGAVLYQQECDPEVEAFCASTPSAKVRLECEDVNDSQSALARIADAEKTIAPMSKRVLGEAEAPIRRDRLLESPLLNLLTDALRNASGAEIAMINTGGVRTDLDAGIVLYEHLYEVSPFNNRTVILSPMKVSTLVKILTRSAQSCGKTGGILFSGIRAVYHKEKCVGDADNMDKSVRLVSVTMNDGTVLYDASNPSRPIVKERDLRVATLDFLASGGSGYDAFKEAPVAADIGIFRELVADQLAKNPSKISAQLDGRWSNDATPSAK